MSNPVVTFTYDIPVPAAPTSVTDSYHKIYFSNTQIVLDKGNYSYYDIPDFFIEASDVFTASAG